MKRTQLYLEDDIWNALRVQAKDSGSTISELVRKAIRERYFGRMEGRRRAMQAAVGLWRDREDIGDSKKYVRTLRGGNRLRRIQGR